jgi:hypothetical protein
MITIDEANSLLAQHLGDGIRARHSIFVGYLMKQLANLLNEDSVLWQITGICHDLDFDQTKEDRRRHGILAAEWLEQDLPPVALLAIQSHDHRTGVLSDTTLADALKLADALAVGELNIGRRAMLEALASGDPIACLDQALVQRPFLTPMILDNANKLSISPLAMAKLWYGAPGQ